MIVLEVRDKFGKIIHLSLKRWKHIQKHPHMHESLEKIKETLERPLTIRYFEDDLDVIYFYKEYKENEPSEKYLLVSVKYLNGAGFVITSFFTNRIGGIKWKME